MPAGRPLGDRKADCHPERPHYGHGLCHKCYDYAYARATALVHNTYRNLRRDGVRAWYDGYKAMLICSRCPERHPACLDFHHINPSDKDSDVSRMVCDGLKKSRILAEIAKCVVLCRNCHAKEHWKGNNVSQ
jgi:hypothetical protein